VKGTGPATLKGETVYDFSLKIYVAVETQKKDALNKIHQGQIEVSPSTERFLQEVFISSSFCQLLFSFGAYETVLMNVRFDREKGRAFLGLSSTLQPV
jgi:hypothetical protein